MSRYLLVFQLLVSPPHYELCRSKTQSSHVWIQAHLKSNHFNVFKSVFQHGCGENHASGSGKCVLLMIGVTYRSLTLMRKGAEWLLVWIHSSSSSFKSILLNLAWFAIRLQLSFSIVIFLSGLKHQICPSFHKNFCLLNIKLYCLYFQNITC